jgi:hypothetical protein
MRAAHVSLYVRDELALRPEPFVRQSGEPWAWLEVGESAEVSVYGSPAAMRRFAAAVIAAAAAAERLRDPPGAGEAALRVVAEP